MCRLHPARAPGRGVCSQDCSWYEKVHSSRACGAKLNTRNYQNALQHEARAGLLRRSAVATPPARAMQVHCEARAAVGPLRPRAAPHAGLGKRDNADRFWSPVARRAFAARAPAPVQLVQRIPPLHGAGPHRLFVHSHGDGSFAKARVRWAAPSRRPQMALVQHSPQGDRRCVPLRSPK